MKNLCALVTIYKPDVTKLKKNIEIMLQYSETVYLLYNSPIISELQFNEKITSIVNEKNIGISRAINKSIKIAASNGFLYALLFDQDSCLTNDNFERLFEEMRKEEELQKVACIGPSLNVRNNIIPIRRWSKNNNKTVLSTTISVNNIITSGMLVNIKHFIDLNGFDERYPLDKCDFLFCWKSLYNGYSVLQSTDAYITHEVGIDAIKIYNHIIHVHAPYRNYFMVRDTLNICFREKETPLYIRFRYFFLLPFRMILFFVMLDKKKTRLKMYWLGIIDFFLKRDHFGSISKILGAK